MRDPFPIPPNPALVQAVKPLADSLSFSSLPLHVHEVLFSFGLYSFICGVISPSLSTVLAGQRYTSLNARTKVNWNVHVVSFFQSCIICGLSLWIIWGDEERKVWRQPENWEYRIWGYSGLTGMCQSFALGYFLWDLVMCAWRVDIFGWGMLAHAIASTAVFSFGYRPYLYFYCPVFLLYELSSPFLNIHWFCDKLGLTGSIYQAINGAFLTVTFFSCRIIWGLYGSFNVFYDSFTAVRAGHVELRSGILGEDGDVQKTWASGDLRLYYQEEEQQRAFMGQEQLPLWLVLTYLVSNITLNILNIYWFGKMIETIRKRFDPPWGTRGVGPEFIHYEPQEKAKAPKNAEALHKAGKGSVKEARLKAEEALNHSREVEGEETQVQRGVYADGHKSVEVTGTRRSARSRRKA